MGKSLYIAATGQHVGKTTSTLGIVAALKGMGIQNLGYCKPMGQELIKVDKFRVDKDAFLFSKIMGFELAANIHSPVTLHRGVTTSFIEDPAQFNFAERIQAAADYLQAQCDITVYEGTGHPGVGSVVNLSNAQVAKMVGAKVVLIAEAGIGNSIDRIDLCLSYFQAQQVPVIGVIINKVIPEKKEKIAYYLKKHLEPKGIPVLGLAPYDKTLSNPIMQTILKAVNGRYLANDHRYKKRVESIIPGSLIEDVWNREKPHHLLLLVSYKRAGEVLKQIEQIAKEKNLPETPLSGVILTGDGTVEKPLDSYDLHADYIVREEIPVISTPLDTLGAYQQINKIEVKINTATPWKVEKANNMIREHVDMQRLLAAL